MHGMYISASGAQSFSRYLDILSNNVANADTTGFRREFPVLQARHAEAIEQGTLASGTGAIEDMGGGVYLSSTPMQFTPGTLEHTGRPMDMALADMEGNTFFLIKQGGDELLTRAGDFWVDEQGGVRTQSGGTVLTASRQPLRIDPRFPVEVGEKGTIRQPEVGVRLSLGLHSPQSSSDLIKAGGNTFRTKRPSRPASLEDRQVRQGYLEKSTVRPMQEMTELIKASRAYEANVRMIQNQDSTTESLINRVLKGD